MENSNAASAASAAPVKRGRGRPKGSKNKHTSKRSATSSSRASKRSAGGPVQTRPTAVPEPVAMSEEAKRTPLTVVLPSTESHIVRSIAFEKSATYKSVVQEGIHWLNFFYDLHDELLALSQFYNAPSATHLIASMLENYRRHMVELSADASFEKRTSLPQPPVLFESQLDQGADGTSRVDTPNIENQSQLDASEAGLSLSGAGSPVQSRQNHGRTDFSSSPVPPD